MTEQNTPPETPDLSKLENLPTSWQREITSLREECASRRTKNNELQAENDALKSKETELAELTDKYEALITTTSTHEANLGRINAAIEAGIPTDRLATLAPRLQGENPEEWEQDAKGLLTLFGSSQAPQDDPSQGHGGDPNAGTLEAGAALYQATKK